MQRLLIILGLGLFHICNVVSANAIANTVIELAGLTVNGAESGEARGIKPQFGFSGEKLIIVYPQEDSFKQGCPDNTTDSEEFVTMPAVDVDGDFAVLFDRGGCSFRQKARAAEAMGAVSVIVANQEESIFNATSNTLTDVCAVDCKVASAADEQTCESSSKCGSNYCLPAFVSSDINSGAFCCVVDDLTDMSVGEGIKISAVFIGVKDGEAVAAVLEDSIPDESLNVTDYFAVEGKMKERSRPAVDGSMIVLISIGTFAVSVGSFIAAREDRKRISWLWGDKKYLVPVEDTGAPANQEADDVSKPTAATKKVDRGQVEELEVVELTTSQGIVMLICASVFLVVLFFLVKEYPRQVVIAVIVMFGFASIYATSYFLIRPVFRLMVPENVSFYKLHTPKFSRSVLDEFYTVESLVGVALALSLVVTWFVLRHNLEEVWFLQNIFSVAVAIMFLSTLRINTLSTGFYILVGFCIYDIFMVFITPFFGDGESIMLSVATAGAGSESVSGGSGGGDGVVDVDALVCERTEDEQMPMLFLCPRFDYRGGFSLLGLGDILIPGIFITYILRVDYFMCRLKAVQILIRNGRESMLEVAPEKFNFKLSVKAHYFFISAVISYVCALILTFIANLQGWTINGVQGQPALLYIVPIVMTVFMTQLGKRNISFLWNENLEELDFGYIKSYLYAPDGTLHLEASKHEEVEASADREATTIPPVDVEKKSGGASL